MPTSDPVWEGADDFVLRILLQLSLYLSVESKHASLD